MKLFQLLVVLFLLIPPISHANTDTDQVKVAFTRDGFLFVKTNGEEEKITEEKAIYPSPPEWSHDSKMLLYQKLVTDSPDDPDKTSNELWVYDVVTKKHQKIFYNGNNPQWSPIENIVAFNAGGVLNISDLKNFYNIALGVDDYTWQPDGKGFIASSGASLRPDGWTHTILYTISIENGYRNIPDLMDHGKKLFVVPKEVRKGDVSVISIGAEKLTYSPDGKWISFVISPTASWSMDSDMLALISSDGKDFEVIDEVILEFTPKWAYTKNLLGYIAGGGRIVFGFKNKDMKVTEIPMDSTVNLTPENYAEMGFTWVDDNSLIVSRVQETEWSNDPKKRPKPVLYLVSLTDERQIKLTNPHKNKGDYQPQFLTSIDKITWLRQSDLVEGHGDLWKADRNGENAEVWIKDVELYSFYQKHTKTSPL
ncbi:TolB domain-containing protein [Sporosarcina thermotolerans]|uniref:TolB domain-containing protein n=1 Tax=Sporosarcina thermotolerans TaxID=633404 RepID=A0AAW9AFN8_9BACL|nr:TolB domain-containing protein [Sporosarcina thermotolerans]MDW0117866.1 TolB domain-containing protein [Sporosarcina thermotolerans]WHT49327.1 TolB domain-containing protein [Sporosarcina thermotolerans]